MKATTALIRPARSEDEEAVLALWEEMTAAHARLAPRFFASTEAGRREARRHNARRLRTTLADRQRGLFVVEETRARGGARVVGMISARVYDTPADPTLVGLRRAHVEEVIVTRTARRRGHGRALLEAAASWAKAQGARQLLLTVWSGNAAADGFYQALGFRTVNRVLATEL